MYVVYVYGGVCTRLCACRGQRRILCVLLHHALPYSLETMNLELTITQQACGCSPQRWGGRKMLSHTLCGCWGCELKAHMSTYSLSSWWYCFWRVESWGQAGIIRPLDVGREGFLCCWFWPAQALWLLVQQDVNKLCFKFPLPSLPTRMDSNCEPKQTSPPSICFCWVL